MDPPEHNSRLVGKLMLPFPLLSDPRGELIKSFGLWDEEDGVAVPSILVIDRSGEIRYLYTGGDFADRPDDEDVFTALEGLDIEVERITGGPELEVKAGEARESVRPDKRPLTLQELLMYFRGVYFTTVALTKRFGGWGRRGRDASGEVSRYQATVRRYRKALEETVALQREGS